MKTLNVSFWTYEPTSKATCYEAFFFIFLPQKNKTPQTSFMMLEVKKTNSRTMNFVSIKLSKEIEIPLYAFNFKKMEMTIAIFQN